MSEEKRNIPGLTTELQKLIDNVDSMSGEECEANALSLEDLELIAGGSAPQTYDVLRNAVSREKMYDVVRTTEEFFGYDNAMLLLRRLFSDSGYKNTDIIVYAYNTYADCESMFAFLDQYC